MTIPKIMIPADKVVVVTGNHSGYISGECLLCGSSGWLDEDHGYPHGAKVMSNRLIHTRECEMTRLLDKEGKFK